MTQSEDITPDSLADSTGQNSSPDLDSRVAAELLRATVVKLATQLRPFPAFFGMTTLQAIELELPSSSDFQPPPELGCVVVLPDGAISELDLRIIPGAVGPAEVEQVEQFTELDLPPDQYIAYATVAIDLLQAEIGRR